MLVRILALAALALSAVPAAAAPLQPSAKWVVNFDAAQCVAQRDYGTSEQPMTLILKQPAMGSVMQVAVRAKGFFNGQPEQVDGGIRFDSQAPIKIPALQWRPAKSPLTYRMINVPLSKFAAASQAGSMRFDAGSLHRDFALTDVAALMKVMDDCVADLRRVWNVPTEVRVGGVGGYTSAGLKKPGEANLSGLFAAGDYPGAAIMQMKGGSVQIAVLIDEQGKVADCSVVESSGVAVLDSQSCAIISARAKFKPAIGLDDKPAKTAHIQRITWRIQ